MNSDSTSSALAVSATGAKVWANAVVEYLVVTNRFDGLGLEDDRGGDFIGAQATGLDGLVAIFAGALVEGANGEVTTDVGHVWASQVRHVFGAFGLVNLPLLEAEVEHTGEVALVNMAVERWL